MAAQYNYFYYYCNATAGDCHVPAAVAAAVSAAGVFTGIALPFAYGCMMLVLW